MSHPLQSAPPRRPRHPFQLCHSRKPAGMQPIRPTPWQLLLLCNDGYYTILKGFPFSSRDIQNLVFDTRFSSPASYCSQLCNKKKSIIVKCLLYHYNGSDTKDSNSSTPSSEWSTTTAVLLDRIFFLTLTTYLLFCQKKLAVKKPSNAYISFQLLSEQQ